jgi:pSer/pThr/pTyr-binding forkhead associated (FHA) protein
MHAKKTSCRNASTPAGGGTAGKNATITITNGCFAGLVIALNKEHTKLGRELDCDVCLDDPHVSREHALIHRRGNEFVLEDLDSRCGTMLNGKPVSTETLYAGDRISIGAFSLEFSC